MDKKLCLLIWFFVGVLVFYLLKNVCGCKNIEGQKCISGQSDGTGCDATTKSGCLEQGAGTDVTCNWTDGCCYG